MRAAALLLAAALLSGQAPPPPPAPPPPVDNPFDAPERAPLATEPVRPLAPPPVVDAYRADPDFQYDRPQAEGPSLWSIVWDWVVRTFFEPIGRYTSVSFWEGALVVAAVLALGWVVARVVGAEGTGVFAGRSPAAPGALLDAEDIAAVDLDARLADALGRGDWREAVRVRYLLVLQALEAAGAVAWRRDKTNRQYVGEVAAARPDLADPFRQVTRAFDAVWYGERPVSQALYGRLAPLFDRAEPQTAASQAGPAGRAPVPA